MILRRASSSWFLPKIEPSSDRSREFPDTSGSSVAGWSRQSGGPFLLRYGVGILRLATGSRFSFIISVLDVECTRGLSSSSSGTLTRSGRTRSLLSSSSSSSDVWAAYIDFLSLSAKVQCLLSEGTYHAILAGTEDSSNSKQYVT